MLRGPYRIHPARLELARYGYTVTELARRAGLSPSAVSLQLSGRVRISEAVRAALLDSLGAESAAEVLAAIPSRESVAA
jgi:transcriptional regulator with XRE-family HTH domain